MSLNGLKVTKGQSISVFVMLKTGMEVAEYYTAFNYRPLISQKEAKYKDSTIAVGPGVKLAIIFVNPGNDKRKFGQYPPPPPPGCVDNG